MVLTIEWHARWWRANRKSRLSIAFHSFATYGTVSIKFDWLIEWLIDLTSISISITLFRCRWIMLWNHWYMTAVAGTAARFLAVPAELSDHCSQTAGGLPATAQWLDHSILYWHIHTRHSLLSIHSLQAIAASYSGATVRSPARQDSCSVLLFSVWEYDGVGTGFR